jgi:hypothetical protein
MIFSVRYIMAMLGYALTASVLTTVGLVNAYAQNPQIYQPDSVVELFTSQGCNSCPPADRVLAELAKRKDTLALAWHVDYWDYLGWKDIFASPENTRRQKAYARSFSKRGVYTPQAVINGRVDVVGSRGALVEQALAELAGTGKGLTVPIDARIENGMLKIRIENSGRARDATLWMVYFDKEREVTIKRGENRGRTLRYTNIVRAFEMIGMVRNQTLQTEFAIADIGRRGHDACALILQKTTEDGTPGPIIGAAFLNDLNS